MHDTRHVVDVDAAGGDVGRHEGVDGSTREPGQRPVALILRSPTVDRRCLDTGVAELLGNLVGAAAGPAEHDRRTLGVDDLRDPIESVVKLDRLETVIGVHGVAFGIADLVAGGIMLVGHG